MTKKKKPVKRLMRKHNKSKKLAYTDEQCKTWGDIKRWLDEQVDIRTGNT